MTMRIVRTLVFAETLVSLSIFGCGNSNSAGVKSAMTTEPARTTGDSEEAAKTPWEACYSSFSPTGDAESDLNRLVRDCGPTGGMKAVTPVRIGQQSSEDPVDRYTFEVPEPGKCYRVYAAGQSTIADLDLLLRGPSKDRFVADVTHDSWPVLPPREPVCFDQPGAYMLEVSVYRGSGRYALQVWGR
jgi:hypothetical protein